MVIIFAIFILLQIASIIYAVKKKQKRNWGIALVCECVITAIVVGLTVYFNGLKGKGSAPGLTYFSEVMAGMGSTVVCGGILLVSIILAVVQGRKSN